MSTPRTQRRRHAAAAADGTTSLTALLTEIQAVREEQARQGAMLARVLLALERDRGPRDRFDGEVLRAIEVTIGDAVTFNAQELVDHAKLHPALRDALLATDATSTREYGYLLSRLRRGADGLCLELVDGQHRLGKRYRLRLVRLDKSLSRAPRS
jgi:hypothetical protein